MTIAKNIKGFHFISLMTKIKSRTTKQNKINNRIKRAKKRERRREKINQKERKKERDKEIRHRNGYLRRSG